MNRQPRQAAHGLRIGGMAATALALGGLSLSAGAVAPAGAATGRVAKSVVVKTVSVASVGTVLASGKTLYTLKASKTACSTSCLKVWPELVLPKGVTKATLIRVRDEAHRFAIKYHKVLRRINSLS